MKLLIVDCFTKDTPEKGLLIPEATVVPTIGSRVFLGYANPPKVVDVVYDYTNKMVVVTCE